jgi:hypothetical protein
MEKPIKLPLSLPFLAKAFWADRFPARSKGLWTGSRILQPSHRHFRSRPFAPDVTARFVAMCRENETTVQAALQVLIASVLFEILPEEVTRLRCNVPVSMRRWCGELKEGREIMTSISSMVEVYKRQVGGEEG